MSTWRWSWLLVVTVVVLVGCGTPTPRASPTLALPTPRVLEVPTLSWTPSPSRQMSTVGRVTASLEPATPTPTPDLPYGWVRPREANLRAGPSLDAAVIVRVSGGTTLRLLGRTEDAAWLYVVTQPVSGPGQRGWIATTLVVTFSAIDELPVISPAP